MSTRTLLTSLFQYKAWADANLIGALAALGDAVPATALRLFHHAHVVDRIFAANLQGEPHAFRETDPDAVPPFQALFDAIRQADHWYLDFLARSTPAQLEEHLEFRFTDGSPARMAREEMLAHVVAHAGYHRGEVGRILTQLTGSSPRDTFTGFLHEAEPARRTREIA